jgi:hypothetical protein
MTTARARSREATVYDGLRETLISPNEADTNLEPANVVDGLYAIMRAIRLQARASGLVALVEHGAPDQRHQALNRLADLIEQAYR